MEARVEKIKNQYMCFGKIRQRRERLPTPVLWPGESHGLYGPWGRKDLDTTEQLALSVHFIHMCFNINSAEIGTPLATEDSYRYTTNQIKLAL